MIIQKGKTHLLVLQSTTFCNIDCKYCYLRDRDKSKIFDLSILPLALESLLNEDLLADELILVWHCGEPLILPIDFYYTANEIICAFSKKSGVVIHQHVQTNGTLINQNHCTLIKETGIKFGLSIDGPKNIHDFNRVTRNGKGTFEQVMKGVELLKSNEILFPVIAVVTDYTLDYPKEFIQFFHDIKIDILGFNIDEIEGVNLKSSHNYDTKSEIRFKYFINEIWNINRTFKTPLLIREFKHTIDNILHLGSELPVNSLITPLSIISINTNGDFSTFCPELLSVSNHNEFLFGNIFINKFTDIYKTSKFMKVLDDINLGVEKCKIECSYFKICHGGAPSNKYSEQGSMNVSKTLNCRYINQIIADVVIEKLEHIEEHKLINKYEYDEIFK